MARGVRVTGTDYGISVTGVAEPTAGAPGYLGHLSGSQGQMISSGGTVSCDTGDRDANKRQAARRCSICWVTICDGWLRAWAMP